MFRVEIKVEPCSEDERYFKNEILPVCKDMVTYGDGVVLSIPYNVYKISVMDRIRVHNKIKRMSRLRNGYISMLKIYRAG